MEDEDPDYQMLVNTAGCSLVVPQLLTTYYLIPFLVGTTVQCLIYCIQAALVRLFSTANYFAAKNMAKQSSYKIVNGSDPLPAHIFKPYNKDTLKKWYHRYTELQKKEEILEKARK